MDEKLLDFSAIIVAECAVKHNVEVSQKSLQYVAYGAVKNDQIANEEWLLEALKTQRSKFEVKRCKEPWGQFNQWQMKAMKNHFGQDVFDFLETHLEEPQKAHPTWTAHFMALISLLGRENAIKEASDKNLSLWSYAISHPLWHKCGAVRYKFYRLETLPEKVLSYLQTSRIKLKQIKKQENQQAKKPVKPQVEKINQPPHKEKKLPSARRKVVYGSIRL